MNAYEELAKAFRLQATEVDGAKTVQTLFKDHIETARRAPLEANAAAQEAAMAMLDAFIESCPPEFCAKQLGRKGEGPGLVSIVAEKTLTAAKQGTRTKTMAVVVGLIACDTSADPVVSELAQSLSVAKQPKVAAAILQTMTELLRAFGSLVVQPKALVQSILFAFQHADKGVRQEATGLVVELHRWVGPSILSVLGPQLKPVQAKELTDLLSSAPSVKPTPTNWLRGQRPLVSDAPIQLEAFEPAPQVLGSTVHLADEDTPSGTVDEFEVAMPVNVLDRVPSNIQELVGSSNWKERKEALDSLLLMLKVPKLDPESRYSELVGMLAKRIATDVNIPCVQVAIGCVEAMACGLRLGFVQYRTEAVQALLERSKERKATAAIKEALLAILYSVTTPADVLPDIRQCLASAKNPQQKQESLLFLAACIRKTLGKVKLGPALKEMCELGLQTIDDGTAEVREASIEVLAALTAAVGEKVLAPMLDNKLDKLKMARVKELASTPGLAATDKKHPAPVVPSKRQVERAGSTGPAPTAPPATAHAAVQKEVGFDVQSKFSEQAALDYFTSSFGEQLVQQLSGPNWKERLEAYEQFLTRLKLAAAEVQPELLVRMLLCKGLKRESNFQVAQKMLSCLIAHAEAVKITREAVALAIAEGAVIEKLSDQKLQKDTATWLLRAGEHCSTGFVVHWLAEQAKGQKSPKALGDLSRFLSQMLSEHGTVGLEQQGTSDLAAFLRFSVQHSNPAVRQAAVGTSAVLYSFLGESIRPLLVSGLPQQVAVILDAEFGKTQKASEPTRTRSTTGSASTGSTAASQQPQQTRDEDAGLPPRPDFSQAVGLLMAKLQDANWKVRKEGLDDLAELLSKRAMGRMALDVTVASDLFSALRARFADTNKNLGAQALELAGPVAAAIGCKAFDRHSKSLIQAAMATLADPKPQVRAAAIKCLDASLATLASAGLGSFTGPAAVSLQSDSPNLRRELLQWLLQATRVTRQLSLTDEDGQALTVSLLMTLSDRSGDVRKAAQSLISAFGSLGLSDSILKMCSKHQPGQLAALQSILSAASQQQKTPQKGSLASTANRRTPSKGQAQRGVLLEGIDPSLKQSRLAQLPTRWSHEAGQCPRRDAIDSLEREAKEVFCHDLVGLLLSPDFREQIAGMSRVEQELQNETLSCDLVAHASDILLRYLTLRMYDPVANPQTALLVKVLDLFEALLDAMDRGNSRISDPEATSFLPYYVGRLGEWRTAPGPSKGTSRLQLRVRTLSKKLCRVYPASKLFAYLIDGLGKGGKGQRTRQEILVEAAEMLSRSGQSVLVSPGKQLQSVALLLSDPSTDIKRSAADLLAQVLRLPSGAELFARHLPDLSAKDREYIEAGLSASAASDLTDDMEDVELQDPAITSALVPPPTPLLDPITVPLASVGQTPAMPVSSILKMGGSGRGGLLMEHPLDGLIDLISCSSDLQCIQALQRLDEYLCSTTATDSGVLVERADQLCKALLIRLRECTLAPPAADDDERKTRARLCRYVTNALVLFAANQKLLRRIDNGVLEMLILDSLRALHGECLQNAFPVEDREQLQKALNVLIVKVMDGCAVNACFRALLSLIARAFTTSLDPDSAKADRLAELLMKCLWKVSKQLAPAVGNGLLDVSALIVDCEQFLRALPPMEWKARAAQGMAHGDLPLRTVKTILHELTERMSVSVMSYVHSSIADGFAASYLKTFLQASGALDPTQAGAVASAKDERLSQGDLERRLKTICDCICSKPDTRMVPYLRPCASHPYDI